MRIPPEQAQALGAAIHSHDFLHRLLREIEHMQQVVFHANARADWKLCRKSAEQILIAEIVLRHRGEFDGIYFALRAMENAGKPWAGALRDLAGTIHSYFTTPLGFVMRRDLFGADAVFVSPDAMDWIGQRERSAPQTDGGTAGEQA